MLEKEGQKKVQQFSSLEKVWQWWSWRVRRALTEEDAANLAMAMTGLGDDKETQAVHRWIESNGKTSLPEDILTMLNWPYFEQFRKRRHWRKHSRRLAQACNFGMDEYQFILMNEALARMRREALSASLEAAQDTSTSRLRI